MPLPSRLPYTTSTCPPDDDAKYCDCGKEFNEENCSIISTRAGLCTECFYRELDLNRIDIKEVVRGIVGELRNCRPNEKENVSERVKIIIDWIERKE